LEKFIGWEKMLLAPGIKNKLLYIVMPPGRSHTGDHKMASEIRKSFLQKNVEMKKEVEPSETIPAELLN
jgi:hypothetical protein